MTADEAEWDPEPAELREGEHPDDDGHAQRNLEQKKIAERALCEEGED